MLPTIAASCTKEAARAENTPFATLATEEDIAKLKADHPNAAVTWSLPPPDVVEKMKAAFTRHFEKQKK